MKKNNYFLYAALVCATSLLHAGTHDFSGSLRVAGRAHFGSTTSFDRYDIEQARLDLHGSLAPYWEYHLRVQVNEFEDNQVGLSSTEPVPLNALPWYPSAPVSLMPQITQVYTTYHQIHGMQVRGGLIPAPKLSSATLAYQSFLGSVRSQFPIGNVQTGTGNHIGSAYQGLAHGVGYDLGVWYQTPLRKIENITLLYSNLAQSAYSNISSLTDRMIADYTAEAFDTKKLRLGLGGRLNYSYQYHKGAQFGFGVGYSQTPLNLPILINVIGSYSGPVQPADRPYPLFGQAAWYSSTTFKDLAQFAGDMTYVSQVVQVNMGFQYQKAEFDLYKVPTISTIPADGPRVQIFKQDGGSSSCWLECGTLLFGGNYVYNKQSAVVAGVEPRQDRPSLEVIGRLGAQWYSNILALITPQGWDDWSESDTQRQARVVNIDGPLYRLLVISVDNSHLPNPLFTGNSDGVFHERVRGIMCGLNYYLSPTTNFKVAIDSRIYEYRKQHEHWQPSKKDRLTQLRFGLESSF